MPNLTRNDVIETGLRKVQDILVTPEQERDEQYQLCFQVFRELALVWDVRPEIAQKLASIMTDWTRDVVLLIEKPCRGPVLLDLPRIGWD